MKNRHLAFFALVQLLAVIAWGLVIAHQDTPPAPAFDRLRGVTYSPFREGHNPHTGVST